MINSIYRYIKLRKACLYSLTIGYWACHSLVLAADNNDIIKIGSYLTPGIITADGNGLFNQLNNAILSEINKESELLITSINRARNGVNTGEFDAYFPELWENLPGDRSEYIVSNPIFYKRIILFTLQNSEFKTLSDIEGHLIGGVKGYAYGEKIKNNPKLDLIYQDNDIINIKLLLNNRLNAVLGGYPGTIMALKHHDVQSQITYDLNKPVAVLESFYVCKNTLDGIKLCQAINKAIDALLEKGTLKLDATTGESRFNASK